MSTTYTHQCSAHLQDSVNSTQMHLPSSRVNNNVRYMSLFFFCKITKDVYDDDDGSMIPRNNQPPTLPISPSRTHRKAQTPSGKTCKKNKKTMMYVVGPAACVPTEKKHKVRPPPFL